MLHLKNLTRYEPESGEEKEIAELFEAFFWHDELGRDWYQAIAQFQPNTFKVKYLPDGEICAINKDASAICPDGGSVVEMASLPNGADGDGGWQFVDGSIIPRTYTTGELTVQAEQKKQRLLADAAKAIAPLQDAVDIGVATPEEEARLKAWKKFRVGINRVDTTQLPAIFPSMPE
ncbi:Bacteriophage tail assembly protein [Edwardsiella tarda]|uniref:Tail fiber assembly protein n=1 Tax=Edwardsiella tarda ATCC 15947 = NBRC 105688 TaxID=667121 RepID=A0AC61TI12_EDWTA|nr:tail fiber assembly protein [Edwardsiella tarda]UAL56638.1 tail fiber assembly protein [Edwardsiella tarda]UCQ00309.1 tail fiber assembly protein [Edwardsiella tarda ATCC 15947 = NBRC 105688]STD27901.1 Bacteriophage tail assembly protein [Edwardsiella tarda]STE53216.1 Bacteriophage tail assembly protein [Edwardsiella tarda]